MCSNVWRTHCLGKTNCVNPSNKKYSNGTATVDQRDFRKQLFCINILKVISCNYVSHSPKPLHATWSSALYGHTTIPLSRDLFLLLNKPFINVMWAFFLMALLWVLFEADRRTKTRSPYAKHTKRQNCLSLIWNLFITTMIKVSSYCIILHGKGASTTTVTQQITIASWLLYISWYCFSNVAFLLHCPLGSARLCWRTVLLTFQPAQFFCSIPQTLPTSPLLMLVCSRREIDLYSYLYYVLKWL